MRRPELEKEFITSENLLILALDVTDKQSIDNAINKAIIAFGGINVWVNNAGAGSFGLFENTSESDIDAVLELNLKGILKCTSAILPHFKSKKSGVIINLSSVAGRVSVPMMGIYSMSKFAVEAISESLAAEVYLHGIRVRLIEPGPFKTNFFGASRKSYSPQIDDSYSIGAEELLRKSLEISPLGDPIKVAKVIYKSALSSSAKLRYPVGLAAYISLFLHFLLPQRLMILIYAFLLKREIKLKSEG